MIDSLMLCMARDGSTSLRNILWNFYALNRPQSSGSQAPARNTGYPYDLGYVTDNFRLWPAIRAYVQKSDSAPLLSILTCWRQQCEVSHGLGFALPVVRSAFGGDLKIVRVVRERSAHVRSLTNQSYIDPEHWMGYAERPKKRVRKQDQIKRPTAVDYREMRTRDWQALSVTERFEWFVDKQTELVERGLRLFPNVLTVKTEDLSDQEVIRELGRFIDPGWREVPDPVHIHRMGDASLDRLSDEHRKYIEQVWQQFDLETVYRDPEYAIRFLLDDLSRRFGEDPEKVPELLDSVLQRARNLPDRR